MWRYWLGARLYLNTENRKPFTDCISHFFFRAERTVWLLQINYSGEMKSAHHLKASTVALQTGENMRKCNGAL